MQFNCVTMLTILLLLYKTPKENVSFVIKRRYYEFIYIHKYQFSWFVKTLYFRRVLFSWIFEIVDPPLLTSTHIQMYMGTKYSLDFLISFG